MKLLTAQQVKDWDAYTIKHEPITTINLMERAAMAFVKEFRKIVTTQHPVIIFCGPGNNGGDGLAIARLLGKEGISCKVYIAESANYSDDFAANETRLRKNTTIPIFHLSAEVDLPAILPGDIVIDALFGTGLNKPLDGLPLRIVQHINNQSSLIFSVDIPSGLPADALPLANMDGIVRADHTLTFQVPKINFFFAESDQFTGNVHLLDIGLLPAFPEEINEAPILVTADELPDLKQRKKFSHKGSYGHALCIGGSYGKIGAAVLMSRACLRTGAGLVSSYLPRVGYEIMQATFPECMAATDESLNEIRNFPSVENYSAIAVGPGLGTSDQTLKGFQHWIMEMDKPCVLDADALNIAARLLQESSFAFPHDAILTPHPKEFDRLAGPSENGVERFEKQVQFAQQHKVYVVLKGAHTTVVTPGGKVYFNSTGNPAMATAGSGDALTGIIVSLLAQGYNASDAAVLGVFLHGYAGDLAAKNVSTITASDIIENLPASLFQLSCDL